MTERLHFHPGASYKEKDWGVENYLRLAADLKKNGKTPLFLLGPQEEKIYRNAVEDAGFRVKVNLPLADIAAWTLAGRFSGLVVGNDTGVMHLIRACGCRSVTICFMDTHLTWAPYPGNRHTVIHASCTH